LGLCENSSGRDGARYISFGNPGTTELPLIDALVDTPNITYIWARLHTAGGLGHGLGNILNASVSGTPLVVTATHPNLHGTARVLRSNSDFRVDKNEAGRAHCRNE
jgi:thiamine pyrophosphate-dependent acetolactate synthase large subunit-like protein